MIPSLAKARSAQGRPEFRLSATNRSHCLSAIDSPLNRPVAANGGGIQSAAWTTSGHTRCIGQSKSSTHVNSTGTLCAYNAALCPRQACLCAGGNSRSQQWATLPGTPSDSAHRGGLADCRSALLAGAPSSSTHAPRLLVACAKKKRLLCSGLAPRFARGFAWLPKRFLTAHRTQPRPLASVADR